MKISKRKIHGPSAPARLARVIETAPIVADFLPSPSELVANEETVKVTISLHRSSVDFFKQEAKANHVPYQAMVRQVVDLYANHWQGVSDAHAAPKRKMR